MKISKKLLSLALALLMALSLLPVSALAEDEQPERGVITYTEHISPRYEAAQTFSEGMAAVKKNGKWGYINTDGKEVIPFQYDLAFQFNEGLAIVGKLANTEKWEHSEWNEDLEDYVPDGTYDYWYYYDMGFIDKNNKLTWFTMTYWDGETETAQIIRETQDIQEEYEYIFHNGYALMSTFGTSSLFDTKGNDVELRYTAISPWSNELAEFTAYPNGYPVNEGFVPLAEGYYNLATGKYLEIDFEATSWNGGEKYISNCLPFNQGLAPVWVCTDTWTGNYDNYSSSYEMGFVNTSGKWVIKPRAVDQYWISGITSTFRVFGETGLCIMSNANGIYGAIDKTGKTVIPFKYQELRLVYEGMLPYAENGKWGFLDAATLQSAIPAQYAGVTGFNNGMAVAFDGTNAFLIDRKGNVIPGSEKVNPTSYLKADGSYLNPGEYVVIESGGKYGYGHIEYTPNLPDKSEMSAWAYDEVTAAIEEDFIPVYLQNLYRNNIKRNEFCSTVIQAITEILDTDAETLVKERSGKSLSDWEKEYPFGDTTDSYVIAAYALGIVNGRSKGVFDPYATISRQEAAAFLTRGAKVLGMDTTVIEDVKFADDADVASWAKKDVSYVYQINVMGGTGKDAFSPLGTYSREQSFVTVYRLYKAMLAQQQ